jgi:4-amino-4-deoxy-L-arabinose transferase-like glycosyltransferase
MATKKKQKGKESPETGPRQVSFSVEPGTKLQITLDVGEKDSAGKVPVTIQVQQIGGAEQADKETPRAEAAPQIEQLPVHSPAISVGNRWSGFESWRSRLKTYDLAVWLFLLAIVVYLGTRLIGLTQFPMYFFTDEAIQTQSIADLIRTGYKDSAGIWFPTYFRNGEYYNISLSVYLQWLPYLLFGKSAIVTRATSIFVTLIAAVSIGLILREVFKLRYWWIGTLFLSITPAWFLHSRTAFEVAEFVALYTGTLCAYLFYRYKSPRYVYLAIFLGALSFYCYSPAQVIVPLTAIGLLISDWRYHWENRSVLLIGLPILIILAVPYIRSSINNPNAPFAHLHTLWSYWFEKIPLSEKIGRYFSEFGMGLSPWYWYSPNERDLPRHLMKGYGHIMLATLPFALLGIAHVLRNLRLSSYRTILIALLVSPAAAALVQLSITRALVFIIPAAILTAIGCEQALKWIENPKKHLTELSTGIGPSPKRIAMALVIFLIGIVIAFISKESINRTVVLALAIILAVQVSGILARLAQSMIRLNNFETQKSWTLSQPILALAAFVILAVANVSMLTDALRNGPLWYTDYGMGGMQYGAFQIFDIIKQYVKERPETKIIFSPDWANGTDVVTRFFLGDSSPVQMASVRGHILYKLPLDDNTLFIMTPQEYDLVKESDKLTNIHVERIIPYPDGNPGFYFVRLRYADNIDEIFAAEKAERQVLQEAVIKIDGQDVKLRYTFLDSSSQAESMALVFDDDPYTLAKTFENNPFFIEMTFPTPRTLNGFSINIGSAQAQITLKCYATPDAEPIVYTFEGQGTKEQPELSFDLPTPTEAQILQIEMLDPLASNPAKVHIWEIKLR